MRAFNFNFASRREGRLARGELLRVGDGNGQERKYEEQDSASEEEKGASAVGRSKGNILEPPFPLSLTLYPFAAPGSVQSAGKRVDAGIENEHTSHRHGPQSRHPLDAG